VQSGGLPIDKVYLIILAVVVVVASVIVIAVVVWAKTTVSRIRSNNQSISDKDIELIDVRRF
jgi:cell division protein FtsL